MPSELDFYPQWWKQEALTNPPVDAQTSARTVPLGLTPTPNPASTTIDVTGYSHFLPRVSFLFRESYQDRGEFYLLQLSPLIRCCTQTSMASTTYSLTTRVKV